MDTMQKVHYARGLITGLQCCDVGPNEVYEALAIDGDSEGFRILKTGVNPDAETMTCVACGKTMTVADHFDIVMALADSGYADEMEFADSTEIIAFASTIHGACRVRMNASDVRRMAFEAGMVEHMTAVKEALETAEAIVNRVINKEKEKMQS